MVEIREGFLGLPGRPRISEDVRRLSEDFKIDPQELTEPDRHICRVRGTASVVYMDCFLSLS